MSFVLKSLIIFFIINDMYFTTNNIYFTVLSKKKHFNVNHTWIQIPCKTCCLVKIKWVKFEFYLVFKLIG